MNITLKCPGCGKQLAPLKDVMCFAPEFHRRKCQGCGRLFTVVNQPRLRGHMHVTTVTECHTLTLEEQHREQSRNRQPCTCGHHRGWHDADGCGQTGCPCEKFKRGTTP